MQPTVDGPFKRGPGGDGGWVVLQKQKKAAAREDFVCVWVLSQWVAFFVRIFESVFGLHTDVEIGKPNGHNDDGGVCGT